MVCRIVGRHESVLAHLSLLAVRIGSNWQGTSGRRAALCGCIARIRSWGRMALHAAYGHWAARFSLAWIRMEHSEWRILANGSFFLLLQSVVRSSSLRLFWRYVVDFSDLLAVSRAKRLLTDPKLNCETSPLSPSSDRDFVTRCDCAMALIRKIRPSCSSDKRVRGSPPCIADSSPCGRWTPSKKKA